MSPPRIALLGFSIECNRFAPVATEADFAARTLIAGPDLLAEARAPAPRMLGELPGFVAAMDAAGDWQPVPVLLAMAEPNGPVDHAFFARLMAQWEAGLRAAGTLDGVYAVLHGAALTTADDDPEGTVLALIRRVCGAAVPVVATYDLHGNVTPADVDLVDVFIGYRTNPHMDMRARGTEAAAAMRRLLGGMRTHRARVRLPIVPPTVTMLTGADVPDRPYGELIDLGQRRMQEPPYAGRIVNVSVMGGFAFADTAFNGLTAVVTATDAAAAQDLAQEIAVAGWARRERFRPRLTALEDAVALALGTADRSRKALIFADVADNPGGGGRGNTMHILEAFHAAGVADALVGVIFDPALAQEAAALGEGASFTARFNRDGGDDFSRPFAAPAAVTAVRREPVRGRRGIFADNTIDLSPAAALRLGGIAVVVASNRVQCADPAFFEAFGLDIGAARAVVVKSRGHFRGGFDEFFRHDQVIEVDAPGLTSPVLSRFAWRHLPRPVVPIDDDATWQPEPR
ncbi:MAG: M81 family metallopeptidase [Rhodospirillales bacterium]|nr:M81 family metallopeptidase [Rhodospirillales bacterium]